MKVDVKVTVLNDDGSEFMATGVTYSNVLREAFIFMERDVLDMLGKWNKFDADRQVAKGKP
jgi:hypothetical protein